jgi:hypothetical protein
MSNSDFQYPSAGSSGDNHSSPAAATPSYIPPLQNPPGDIENARKTRCATGIRFITTIHGILNIVIIVS